MMLNAENKARITDAASNPELSWGHNILDYYFHQKSYKFVKIFHSFHRYIDTNAFYSMLIIVKYGDCNENIQEILLINYHYTVTAKYLMRYVYTSIILQHKIALS